MNDKSKAYVSRGGDKLASVTLALKLDFKNKVILDIGSSTGGFTDFALQNEAKKVIAVEKGKNQLHSSLHKNSKIELHEQTDIFDFSTDQKIDYILIDTSFISIRRVLAGINKFFGSQTEVVAMVKPQFEALTDQKQRGIIKNERIRRQILKDFETWAKKHFVIKAKTDSTVPGNKGNLERFYLLRKL